MILGSVTNKIYHGCAIGYANRERKLIDFEKSERCLLPTDDPFWMETWKMQTRNSEKNRQLLHLTFTTVKRIIRRKVTFKYNQTIINYKTGVLNTIRQESVVQLFFLKNIKWKNESN